MGARGRIPKDATERVRRNKVFEAELEAGEFPPLGPALPQYFGPDGGKVRYSKRTRERYERWRRSPQSRHFLASDWDRLLDLAPLWHALEMSPLDTKLTAEIRAAEKTLGATIEDRLRAHIKVTAPKPAEDAPQAAKPRERLRVVG